MNKKNIIIFGILAIISIISAFLIVRYIAFSDLKESILFFLFNC